MAPKVKLMREEFAQTGLNVVRNKGFLALTVQVCFVLFAFEKENTM